MFGGGNYPINDLDIFEEFPEEKEFNLTDTNNKPPSTPIRTNQLIIEGDGYNVTKLSYDHGK